MITWLTMFLQKIEGANLIIAVIAALWLLYLIFFYVVKANRTKKAFKTALITGAVITEICDIVWFFKFFDNFDYLNPGLGGILWLCLLPVLLFIAVMYLSYVNASRYEFDKKKREKEAAKQKKKERRRKKFEENEE
ncbi:MAG: hypothetical protein IJ945_10000 [Oscillospiraceae bacterium]|nr:hypothetical protein [Oscillospiraceae bacterium]